MKLRYIYSACVVISTEDLDILCDPWFTPGAYDGTWYQYPPIEDPVTAIGPVDAIYISHVHPDHYDPAFLRKYLAAYPDTPLWFAQHTPPLLQNTARLDGYKFEEFAQKKIGETEILLVPNTAYDYNIDSALAVKRNSQVIVNMNDNPFDMGQIETILDFCPDRHVDFLLLPYAGAGPYPQTFDFEKPEELKAAMNKKEQAFIENFQNFVRAFNPEHVLPFAGKYYLGGSLIDLNPMRGVPDAVKMLSVDPERVIVLADGGEAVYDVGTGTASAVRTKPYDQEAIQAHLRKHAAVPFAYEREITPDADHRLPLLPLMRVAARNARKRWPIEGTCWLCLHPTDREEAYCFDVAGDGDVEVRTDLENLTPRWEIKIDPRLLFGLLSRFYIWELASVGSHYRSKRVPNDFRRDVNELLNFLHT